MTARRLRERTDRKRRGGFTLIELLIVMAILVLLVSLVGPRLLGSKKKADIGAAKAQIGLFEAALERFALDMGRYPTTEEGLQALITPPSGDSLGTTGGTSDLGVGTEPTDLSSGLDTGMGTTGTSTASTTSRWDGPYLKKNEIPLDPWGNPYQYEYPSTHGNGDNPDIWSFGPDGQDGTEDDITNWGPGSGGSGTGTTEPGMNDLGGSQQPLAPELPPE